MDQELDHDVSTTDWESNIATVATTTNTCAINVALQMTKVEMRPIRTKWWPQCLFLHTCWWMRRISWWSTHTFKNGLAPWSHIPRTIPRVAHNTAWGATVFIWGCQRRWGTRVGKLWAGCHEVPFTLQKTNFYLGLDVIFLKLEFS